MKRFISYFLIVCMILCGNINAFAVEEGARRAGDPAVLIASSERIREELGWVPVHSDIEEVIRTAWKWHKNHPYGYQSK